MTSLVQAGMSFRGFALSRVGIQPLPDLTFEDWQEAGGFLRLLDAAVHWWIGDWLNIGEARFGERYSQAIEVTGFEYQTVANDKWVAARIEVSRRREELTFSHHLEVAALTRAEQEEMLDRAVRDKMTRAELRDACARLRHDKARILRGAGPGGLYSVLYADPPWQATHPPGEALTADEICGLTDARNRPLAALAADLAVCFLWCPPAHLTDALRVLEAWGFTYRDQFVWDRGVGESGVYNVSRHDLLLVGGRGSLHPDPGSTLPPSVFWTEGRDRRGAGLDLVEDLFPGGAGATHNLAVFGGVRRPGWHNWGEPAPTQETPAPASHNHART